MHGRFEEQITFNSTNNARGAMSGLLGVNKVYLRYLSVLLFGLLIAESAATQTNGPSTVDREQYRLSGVLTSDTRRIALLNGRTIHEGARIGDVIVESIDSRQIQIRRGSTRQFVRVGGSFTAAASTAYDRQMMVVTRPTPETRSVDMPTEMPIDTDLEHVVVSGETLSGIALRYKQGGATMEQMMVALFNDNRHAFGSNFNWLKAGATLKIPDQPSIDRLSPAMAAAAVWQQHDVESAGPALQAASSLSQAVDRPVSPSADTYGPIDRGDTLLEIARSIRLADESLTTNQVMIALIDGNPHAFGSNINVLYAGSVLTLPKETTVASFAPAAARAEVERQMETWLASSQHAVIKDPALNIDTIMSAENSPLN